ncbi:MAG: RdgB/HAM1 family non-canonical purine NTP pyrophosphatase [Chitinophagaceae bacterium]|nr:MAG: RdgB/HAM1 family non-canonical purine NTP pyrophosphatase [Chitinophagaceae bacterium]
MELPTLIFATNNQHKADEIRSVLNNLFEIRTLRDAGILIDIPEPHDTLEANAAEKSGVIHQLTGGNCFSEDTGLEVDALNGEPGVRSARYAEGEMNYRDNTAKLLDKLKDQHNRSAQFKTIISLVLDDKEYQFEGICKGKIITVERGTNGFGYDPVFIPEGAAKTFAEMTMEEKNTYSHRKKATQQFVEFLKSKYGQDKN